VVAVAALFGGLDSVDAKPKVFNVDQPYSDGQFTVTVERAAIRDEISAGDHVVAPAEPGHVYLGLVTMVRNDGTIRGLLEHELDLRDQPRKEFTGVFRHADGSNLPSLGPKLTDELVFLWKLPNSAIAPGSKVTVRVWQKMFSEMMVTYGKDWLASETSYAQVTMPVV
jgi:hypothetical protein